MRIKRQIPTPIKSYYIKGREIDATDFNIHLFSDVADGKKIFSFIISKDKQEELTVVDKNNIISMIHVEKQDNVKPLISKFGAAIKEVYSLDRKIFDHDLISSIENNIKGIDHEMWKSSTATKYFTPAEKIEMAKRPVYEKSALYGEDDDDIRATKPIIMIETLERLGLINIESTSPNGDETKFKFTINNNNNNTKFNISCVRHHGLTGRKSELMKDFHNDNIKGLGNGGLGLLTHLGEYGFFGALPTGESKEDKISRAKSYFKENIFEHVKKEDLVYSKNEDNMSNYTRLFLEKNSSFQTIERQNPETQKLMTDFLEYRGLAKKTVEKIVAEKLIFTGDTYMNVILKEKNEVKNDIIPKYEYSTNYFYENFPFFKLRKANGDFSGAERFIIEKSNNKDKPYIYDKRNTGSIDGRFFAFGEMEEPKLAILHESIIDSFSSYDLLDAADVDVDSIKYMSVQGTSHMRKFFMKNVGFWTETKSSVDTDMSPEDLDNRTKAVYINQNTKDITPEIKEEYIRQLNEFDIQRKIHFIQVGDLTYTMNSQISQLQELFGEKFVVEKKEKKEDINYKDYDIEKSILVDKETFSDFLGDMKIKFEYDKESKKSLIKTFYTKISEVKLDDRKKSIIKKRIKKLFGTDNLAFCLDNDHAGLPFIILFSEMKRHFGVNTTYMIPDDLTYDNFQGTTLKSMLQKHEELCEKGEYEEAYKKVHEYILQLPTVDNNDVLKKYLELKKTAPKEASKILENKLQQLKIDKDSDLFPKKKNKRVSRPS